MQTKVTDKDDNFEAFWAITIVNDDEEIDMHVQDLSLDLDNLGENNKPHRSLRTKYKWPVITGARYGHPEAVMPPCTHVQPDVAASRPSDVQYTLFFLIVMKRFDLTDRNQVGVVQRS